MVGETLGVAAMENLGEMPALGAHTLMRVVLIDDHHTFSDLLSAALAREPDLTCVGQAAGVHEGIELCATLLPDLVVLDYRLSDGDGLQAAEAILAQRPLTRILMLTGNPAAHIIRQAAAIGICGFLPKDGALSVLLDVMRRVRTGEFIVAPSLISRTGMLAPATEPLLTAREMEVLRLMSQGFDVATNARTLGISTHTCRGHVKAILGKLEAHTQLEAVAAASRLGLLQDV